MKCALVESNDRDKKALEAAVKAAEPSAVVEAYSGIEEVAFAEGGAKAVAHCDVAFVNPVLADGDGMGLAEKMQRENPRLNLVFVADPNANDENRMLRALSLRCSGYLLKPVTEQAVSHELEDLRYPVESPEDCSAEAQAEQTSCNDTIIANGSSVQTTPARQLAEVRCFGNFEVFANGVPVPFHRKRTRELFAYLVDRRGSFCDLAELIGVLWDGELPTKQRLSYLRHLTHDLSTALVDAGCEDVLVRSRGHLAVDCSKIRCDYLRHLAGEKSPETEFRGEYMSQYIWSRATLAALRKANTEKPSLLRT